MPEPKGNVILLVGPSCAGKSTLAKALQQLSPQPFLVQSLDGVFAAMPEEWGSGGAHARDGFRYDWSSLQTEGGTSVRRVAYGPVGVNILRGFHRAVAAYADAGVNVVVDDMLLDLDELGDWADALKSAPAWLVNVTATREELPRREGARQIHRTLGLVAGHFELHQSIDADARIDTSAITPTQAARSVLDMLSSRPGMALRTFRAASS